MTSRFTHLTASGNNVVRHRKMLGFGPVLPHSIYRREPLATHSPASSRFVEDLTLDTAAASSFVIRKDSSTDKNTGVTHVYVSVKARLTFVQVPQSESTAYTWNMVDSLGTWSSASWKRRDGRRGIGWVESHIVWICRNGP
ncbi:uncharacterized protein LAESUDRAFT_764100 [Laetiporus sulphureus 93-53]|uniref:Uncharacterized protein n=1 Tax=Laetiporus sulphureus 93-53 TaxID=1314785 RepID=A0A165BHQ9_9APHY|nr:uncharacterized protein LAESUDRAFT_764100 [Laetiporus sulphureus 93-53]KZT01077.1 hypothetical protein LAESUDRAFT_764100 [Laetiporus sulphureus 93-53]